jgi:hypothetical protein
MQIFNQTIPSGLPKRLSCCTHTQMVCDIHVKSDIIFLLGIVNMSALKMLDINSEFCTINIFVIPDS